MLCEIGVFWSSFIRSVNNDIFRYILVISKGLILGLRNYIVTLFLPPFVAGLGLCLLPNCIAVYCHY